MEITTRVFMMLVPTRTPRGQVSIITTQRFSLKTWSPVYAVGPTSVQPLTAIFSCTTAHHLTSRNCVCLTIVLSGGRVLQTCIRYCLQTRPAPITQGLHVAKRTSGNLRPLDGQRARVWWSGIAANRRGRKHSSNQRAGIMVVRWNHVRLGPVEADK